VKSEPGQSGPKGEKRWRKAGGPPRAGRRPAQRGERRYVGVVHQLAEKHALTSPSGGSCCRGFLCIGRENQKSKGPKRIKDPRMAAIFGTKLRVWSWIEVVAWKIDTRSPTPTPISSAGAAIRGAPERGPNGKGRPQSLGSFEGPPLGQITNELTTWVVIRPQPSTSTKRINLKGQGDHHRGKHDHTHGHQSRRHHHIDNNKGDKQEGSRS
jgi:hypothetical protein